MANGQPRPAFYVAVFAVVVGLIGLAIWRYGGNTGGGSGTFSSDELKQIAGNAENSGNALFRRDFHRRSILAYLPCLQ